MKIVVAPDSFKGSLTSIEVASIIKAAIKSVDSNYEVGMKPMADGGEGTLESLLSSTEGERVFVTCTGPLGQSVQTSYAILRGDTAIIEGASIAGLPQVPLHQRNPDDTTSFGIGEVILDALDKGCQSFIIGIGGSATNDGGLGMLLALGMKAYDEGGKKLGPYGKDLLTLHHIDLQSLDPRLKEVTIKVACDVNNPLCGKQGASYIYGPQKGAIPEQVKRYDVALEYFSTAVENILNKKFKEMPGAGAAGGLGFALLTLGAQLVSGAELLADAIELEAAIQQADLVITGEGQTDEQTLYGKAPGYVAKLAEAHSIPTILISGSLQGNMDLLRKRFAGCFSIVTSPLTLEQCMEQAEELLYEQTKHVIHFMTSVDR